MENLALEFINTQWYVNNKPYEEKLKTEQWVTYFAKRHNFSRSLFRDVDRLINLRSIFYNLLVDAINCGEIPSEFVTLLNEYLSKIQFRQKAILQDNQVNIIYLPKIKEIDLLPHIITNSFIDLLNYVETGQLKICQNEDCAYLFYDGSKNHSAKYCSTKCSSLIKVRKHRNRRKAQV